MVTAIIAISIIIILIVIGIRGSKKFDNNLEDLSNSRPTLSRSEYIDQLTKKGYTRKTVEVVYDSIKEFTQLGDFSIYPEDSIHEVFGLEDLDDVELIMHIHKKLNIPFPEQTEIDSIDKYFTKTDAEYLITLCELMSGKELTIKKLK